MASIDRAYGARGIVIAVAAGAIAGLVHGVLAGVGGPVLYWVSLGAAAVVMLLAGAVSARRGRSVAVMVSLAMAVAFFWTRAAAWSVGSDGEVIGSLGPGAWSEFVAAALDWMVELVGIWVVALVGCLVGCERRD